MMKDATMAEATGRSGTIDTPLVAGALVIGALAILIMFNRLVVSVSVGR